MARVRSTPPTMDMYAGIVSRLFAAGVDIVLAALMLAGVSWLGDQVMSLLDPGSDLSTEKDAVVAVIASFFLIGYLVVFWALAGQTPGNLLFGIRVVRPDGRLLGFGRAIARAFLIVPLIWGLAWVPFTNRRQALYDMLLGTVVVYTTRRIQDFETILEDARQVATREAAAGR